MTSWSTAATRNTGLLVAIVAAFSAAGFVFGQYVPSPFKTSGFSGETGSDDGESPFSGRWTGLVIDRGTANVSGVSDDPTLRYTVEMTIREREDGTLAGSRTDSDLCGGRLIELVRYPEHATFDYVETLNPTDCVPESRVTIAPAGSRMTYFEMAPAWLVGERNELEAAQGTLKRISQELPGSNYSR